MATQWKTRFVTALSVAGVLGAGSAAALVNTQILDSGSTESGASQALLPPPSSVELSVPAVETTQPAVAEAALTQSEDGTTPAEPLPPAAEQPSYFTEFSIGDAGTVQVDVVNGQLVLMSHASAPGWTVTRADDDNSDASDAVENDVNVDFASETLLVHFQATFVEGAIVPTVGAEPRTVETAAPAAPSTAGTEAATAAHTAPPATDAPESTAPATAAGTATGTSVDHDDDDDDDRDRSRGGDDDDDDRDRSRGGDDDRDDRDDRHDD